MKKIADFLRNQKLNTKFTLIIILFTIIPIGIMSSVLFYIMEQNVVEENQNYMEYTMQRREIEKYLYLKY